MPAFFLFTYDGIVWTRDDIIIHYILGFVKLYYLISG